MKCEEIYISTRFSLSVGLSKPTSGTSQPRPRVASPSTLSPTFIEGICDRAPRQTSMSALLKFATRPRRPSIDKPLDVSAPRRNTFVSRGVHRSLRPLPPLRALQETHHGPVHNTLVNGVRMDLGVSTRDEVDAWWSLHGPNSPGASPPSAHSSSVPSPVLLNTIEENEKMEPIHLTFAVNTVEGVDGWRDRHPPPQRPKRAS